MAKAKKSGKRAEAPLSEKKHESLLEVDERGEPVISDDDPEIVQPPDEELETIPPDEPPIPGEGP
jgi:hypothetical protein